MRRIDFLSILAVAVIATGGLANAQSRESGSVQTVTVVVVGAQPEPVRIPPGYRSSFDDGRLNPHRGEKTAVGRAQMQKIWTDEVPMRLIRP